MVKSVKTTTLWVAVDALNLMEQQKIMALPVVEADGSIAGALNMHSLFRAGVV